MMKITLLLDNSRHFMISKVIEMIDQVLQELEVDIKIINLDELPYFTGSKLPEMDKIITSIEESKGVIILTQVSLVGIHAAVQSFFDHMSIYDKSLEGKPLLPIAYSEWMGEIEAIQMMSRAWGILGGYTGGMIGLNSYMELEQVLTPIEREIEQFYRLLKQHREPLVSSQRYYYINNLKAIGKEGKQQLDRKFGTIFEEMSKNIPNQLEVKNLLRNPMDLEEEVEYTNRGIYTKPNKNIQKGNVIRRIKNLPHYFIASHDKKLDAIIQYIVLDTGEKAYLTIKEGNCEVCEGMSIEANLEISLTEEAINEIFNNTLTYQRAFMIGRLKAKGDFAIVSKMDQIFSMI
ncbi:MAG: NAD(P)H-dependent oxidoreductase [Cellulosilyticaceae bacterium]